jgi:hypothetical protein
VTRVSAPRDEGVGLKLPGPRHPAKENPEWFPLDHDDDYEDPDAPAYDPLPTERHRTVPS